MSHNNYAVTIGWTDKPVPGTEDWEAVTRLDASESYDWAELRAFYSPSARRYFWASGSGCSCNSWDDDINSTADFEDGDKEALRRALRDFADSNSEYGSFDPNDLTNALADLAKHIPTTEEN